MAAQRGIYTVTFTEVTVTSAGGNTDLFEIVPADDRPLELVAVFLGQKSEAGDAADEMLTITVITDLTVSSNGTATTPRPLDPRDGAAGFTAEINGPTEANTGTAITMVADSFNVRGGLQWIFPEAMRPKVDQADTAMYVRLHSAAADDITMSGTAWVREL
jgi:hypothetical protein